MVFIKVVAVIWHRLQELVISLEPKPVRGGPLVADQAPFNVLPFCLYLVLLQRLLSFLDIKFKNGVFWVVFFLKFHIICYS